MEAGFAMADKAEEWLKENDPRRCDRNHEHPFHSRRQRQLRRSREICCGLMDTHPDKIRAFFRSSDYPRFEHDGGS